MERVQTIVRLPKGIAEQVRDISYHERKTLNDFMVEAISSHVGQYVRERGEAYPKRPKK